MSSVVLISRFDKFSGWRRPGADWAVASDEVEYNDDIINGYKLGFFEQLALEDPIDQDIPDGQYWFELETGIWEPVGGPAIGLLEVPEDYREYVESRLKKQDRRPRSNLLQPRKNSILAAYTGSSFAPQLCLECDYPLHRASGGRDFFAVFGSPLMLKSP